MSFWEDWTDALTASEHRKARFFPMPCSMWARRSFKKRKAQSDPNLNMSLNFGTSWFWLLDSQICTSWAREVTGGNRNETHLWEQRDGRSPPPSPETPETHAHNCLHLRMNGHSICSRISLYLVLHLPCDEFDLLLDVLDEQVELITDEIQAVDQILSLLQRRNPDIRNNTWWRHGRWYQLHWRDTKKPKTSTLHL